MAAAQYGPGGQYGPNSGGSSSGSGSGSGSSGSSGFDTSEIPFGGNEAFARHLMMAHGILASLAFVIFLPVGGILIRLGSFRGLVWVHAALQLTGYVFFIAAFGIGVYMAKQIRRINNVHPIIGIVVFALLFFQPILGLLHHWMFRKYSRRVVWSYGHLWLGRIIITLGIINGGLGLRLANNSHSGEIAYGVVAAVMWLAYVVSAVVGEMRRRKARKNSSLAYDKAGVRQGSESHVVGGSPHDSEGSQDRNREYYGNKEEGGHRFV